VRAYGCKGGSAIGKEHVMKHSTLLYEHGYLTLRGIDNRKFTIDLWEKGGK
jgi:hypothetical protein